MSATPARVERDLIVIFNILASVGFFSIVAILVPALFSPHVKRSRAWLAVIVSWVLYSISYLLLIGRQIGPNPSLGLCMFQAALVYATSPLCAITTTCFAFDIYLKLSATSSKDESTRRMRARTLIFFPWVVGLVIAGEAILTVNDASKVQRNTNNFYCHITSPVPSMINIVIVFLCVLVITPLEIYTGIVLYRNWVLFRRLSKTRARIALSTLIRLALFSVIISLSLGLTIVSATHFNQHEFEPAWRLVLVSMPIFSALCFGTQRDIVETWLFWKRRESIPIAVRETAETHGDNYTRIKIDV